MARLHLKYFWKRQAEFWKLVFLQFPPWRNAKHFNFVFSSSVKHISFWFHLYSTPFPSPQLWSWGTRHIPGEFPFWLFGNQDHHFTCTADKIVLVACLLLYCRWSGLVKNTHPLLKVFMWKRNGSYGRSKETLWHCYGFYVFAQGPAWSEEGAGRGSSDPYQQHSFLPPSFSLRCLGRYVR